MSVEKLFKYGIVAFLAVYSLGNVLFIIKAEELYEFGPEVAGPYSIYYSLDFFRVYHLWGIIVSVTLVYAYLAKSRILLWISLLLFIIVSFYPNFTTDKVPKKGEATTAPSDSVGTTRDSLVIDSMPVI